MKTDYRLCVCLCAWAAPQTKKSERLVAQVTESVLCVLGAANQMKISVRQMRATTTKSKKKINEKKTKRNAEKNVWQKHWPADAINGGKQCAMCAKLCVCERALRSHNTIAWKLFFFFFLFIYSCLVCLCEMVSVSVGFTSIIFIPSHCCSCWHFNRCVCAVTLLTMTRMRSFVCVCASDCVYAKERALARSRCVEHRKICATKHAHRTTSRSFACYTLCLDGDDDDAVKQMSFRCPSREAARVRYFVDFVLLFFHSFFSTFVRVCVYLESKWSWNYNNARVVCIEISICKMTSIPAKREKKNGENNWYARARRSTQNVKWSIEMAAETNDCRKT